MICRKGSFYILLIIFSFHTAGAEPRLTRTTTLEESDNNFFLATDRAFPEHWYSRLLELSMHVWADFDMLQRGSGILLPDHLELVFDASIGKLVYLNWCLDQMIHHKKGSISYNDVSYFVQIMQSVYKNCIEIAQQSSLKSRIESTQEILSGIMQKIDAAFLNQQC